MFELIDLLFGKKRIDILSDIYRMDKNVWQEYQKIVADAEQQKQ